jgi:hypothetical protein
MTRTKGRKKKPTNKQTKKLGDRGGEGGGGGGDGLCKKERDIEAGENITRNDSQCW